MNKQINLYRNVFREEQKRRKFLAAGIFSLALAALGAWAGASHFMGVKNDLDSQIKEVEGKLAIEQGLLDSLAQEVKERDTYAGKDAKNDFSAALAALELRKGPSQMSQVVSWLGGWKGDGARLTKIEVEGERLSIGGEAKDRAAARAALAEMAAQVALSPGWAIGRQTVSGKDGALAQFALEASNKPPPAPAPEAAAKPKKEKAEKNPLNKGKP